MDNRKRLIPALLLAVIVLAYSLPVFAGVGGVEFQDIYELFRDWCTGYLGRALSLGLFLVGIAMGIVRQSLMAAATGVGSAIMVQYTPNLIESIATACF